MSLVLVAVATAIAASVGYFAAKNRGRAGGAGDGEPKPDDVEDARQRAPRRGASSPRAGVEPTPFGTLPLALGDVVAQGGEERWLSGAIVARDGGRVVSVLFLAPEGGTYQAVAAFARPRREIYWLSPAEVECPEEPPGTIEIGATSYQRRARLPVKIQRMGQGAPDVGETVLWGSYEAGGRDVAIVLCGGGRTHAWSGTRLDEGEYDRLGKGGDE